MNEELKSFLQTGYTPFQTCDNAARILKSCGFKQVPPRSLEAEKGGKYFFTAHGTVVAYTVGNAENGFMIAASHTDSPALKIKGEKPLGAREKRLNCEAYGGAVNYTFFDIPMRICGRVCIDDGDAVKCENVVSPYRVTVPSLAVHQNRGVNSGFAPSVQNDMAPLLSLGENSDREESEDKNIIDFDLFVCPDVEPYLSGRDSEFLCSPRIDNLTSVYCSLKAIVSAKPVGINVAVCFNSEETGSRTYGSAGGSFFPDLLKDLCAAAKIDPSVITDKSFLLSVDNAHAVHPAHPEKSDPVNTVLCGGGIVLKRHVNYATDGLSAAALKKILKDLPVQTFYSNSDLPCGSTVGLIAAAGTGLHACDIGIAQLAMHSAVETCAIKDVDAMQTALSEFYSRSVVFTQNGVKVK